MSLYGHKKPEKADVADDSNLLGDLNAQEREENKQAVTNVIAEKAHIESYNRFREL